jgi:GrpB-like predicted nucleotidyltransferase (UPF0157 family)
MSLAPIVVVPYDPCWPALYRQERAEILAVLGDRAAAIEHMGSTAIPGLGAKPIIDIMLALHDLGRAPECIKPLATLGYEYVPEFEALIPERRYFRKCPAGIPTHHLHMFALTGFYEGHELIFRDYLRRYPELAREYYELKQALAEKYRDQREAYTDAKTPFVRAVVERAQREHKGERK